MPELPDITVYIEALEQRVRGTRLRAVRVGHPFLLRTVDPPLSALPGREMLTLRRVGKRIALGFEGDLWLVLHLMIAGRLHWFPAGKKKSRRSALAEFTFDGGTLTLTDAGTQRRAALHVFGNSAALAPETSALFTAGRSRSKSWSCSVFVPVEMMTLPPASSAGTR